MTADDFARMTDHMSEDLVGQTLGTLAAEVRNLTKRAAMISLEIEHLDPYRKYVPHESRQILDAAHHLLSITATVLHDTAHDTMGDPCKENDR